MKEKSTPSPDIVVLLVDDQLIIGEVIKRMLATEEDITLHHCQNGEEALSHAEKLNPTVILQDLTMPNVNGLDLVCLYRKSPILKDTPVMVLSSTDLPQTKKEAFAVNVDDYLIKLPDKIELIARIRHQSRSHFSRIERDDAYVELRASQEKLIELNEKLTRLSHVEGLTELSNRRYLDMTLETEWGRTSRARQDLSLLMIDVDHFKKYNDTKGHLAGDEVLKKVAAAIKSCLYRPADLPARFGGEEFVVVLPGTDANGALLIAQRIGEAVERLSIPHRAPGAGAVITVSIGGASTQPQPQGHVKDLLELADQALYVAKNQGRNQWVIKTLDPVAQLQDASNQP